MNPHPQIPIKTHFKPLVAIALLFMMTQGCTSAPPQSAFATPEQAADSLVIALRAADSHRVRELFGPKANELISSGDQAIDRDDVEQFLANYDQKHQLVRESDGSVILLAGESNWPFPVPLVQEKHGWIFDTESGIEEITDRRVGRNEDAAVQVCLAIVDAQREYVTFDPAGQGLLAYAQKFLSDPGKKNGLYWETSDEQTPSPLGSLIATARSEGYLLPPANAEPKPQPYHGYRYRMLTSQGSNAPGGEMNYMIGNRLIGGFGVVAYPAEYGSSGVKSFIVNQLGIVYEKDLGRDTTRIATSMTSFDPGPGWEMADTNSPTTRESPARN